MKFFPDDMQRLFVAEKVKQNPDAVATIKRLYDKYYPAKLRFTDKLYETSYVKNAVLINMSPEDSVTFLKAIAKVKHPGYSFFRRGRGHRYGIKKYRQMLPVKISERFTIYWHFRYSYQGEYPPPDKLWSANG